MYCKYLDNFLVKNSVLNRKLNNFDVNNNYKTVKN